MILFNPTKYRFIPIAKRKRSFKVFGTRIEIKDIWGKTLYTIAKHGDELIMNEYIFIGNFDYLKIRRREDKGMGTLGVQIFCENCGETVYNLSLKLPSLFIIKTDFHVTKD